MKCRFQDNLEFLQWMKKFWDTYYSGNAYDAVARRNASAKKGTKKMNSVKPRVVTSRPSTASSRSTPTTRSTGLKSNTGVKSNTLKSKSVDNHAAEQQWYIYINKH